MMRWQCFLFAAGVLLPMSCSTTTSQKLRDPEIGMIVRVSNLAEVREGELAREKGVSTAVRDFANMMILEHSAASAKAEADLGRADIAFEDSDLSRQIDAGSGAATESLRATTGAAFDRAYINRSIEAHKYILGLIDSTLAPAAHNKALRTILTDMRATVQKHLTRAQEILNTLPR